MVEKAFPYGAERRIVLATELGGVARKTRSIDRFQARPGTDIHRQHHSLPVALTESHTVLRTEQKKVNIKRTVKGLSTAGHHVYLVPGLNYNKKREGFSN